MWHAPLAAITVASLLAAPLDASEFAANHLFLATDDGVMEFDTSGTFVRTIDLGAPVIDVAFGPAGTLYASLHADDEVREIDADANLVTSFTDPSLSGPYRIAIGPNGSLYVPAWYTDTVVVFHPGGSKTGEIGSSANLTNPSGVLVGPDGHVLVCSSWADEVVEFDPAGVLVRAFGSGVFSNPRGLAVGRYGDILVANWPAATLVRTMAGGGVVGSLATLGNPKGIVMGPDGRAYVALGNLISCYDVSASDPFFVADFATAQPSQGSVDGLAFAPQRFRVKVIGTLVTLNGKQKVREFATLSLLPFGDTVMLEPSPVGELVWHFKHLVLHGGDTFRSDHAGREHAFQATSVGALALNEGSAAIHVTAKGTPDAAGFSALKKVKGRLQWRTQAESFDATFVAVKRLN